MPRNKGLAKSLTPRGVAKAAAEAHGRDMVRRSPLDDPGTSAHAWARYRRLMKWMAAFSLAIVLLTLGVFYWQNGLVSVHFFIAIALGIGVAVLLMAALMGLVFLSSGTGHDESVSDIDDQDDVDPSGGRSR